MPDSPLLDTVRRYRARLDALEVQSTARLVANYQSSWRRLDGMLSALLLEIGDAAPTRAQLLRMERYRTLMAQITNELLGLQALTGTEIDLAAEAAIDAAVRAVAEMIGMQAGFNALPRSAIISLLGFLDPGGALYARLRLLAGTAAEAVSQAMIEGITLGFNPRKIARMVQEAFARGLSDALRFVRTAQLWAYREAHRAQYIANQDIVEGWQWVCALDDRACMACVAMHGTVHAVGELLNDHHNGRCAMAPIVRGFDRPVTQTGVEWFEAQSEAVQRRMMGGQHYRAWRAGRFQIADYPDTHENDVYGEMRVVKPLWKLLGAAGRMRPAEIETAIGINL